MGAEMPPEPFSPDEARAAAIVQRLLGGRAQRPPDGRTYDFDIVSGGEILASVEVKQLTVPAARALPKAIEGRRRCAGVNRGWDLSWLDVASRNLRTIVPAVCDLLAALEASGVERFGWDAADSHGVDPEDDEDEGERGSVSRLAKLGVIAGHIEPNLPAGHITFHSVTADFGSWTAVEEAVEDMAGRKAQLEQADGSAQRLMFMWVTLDRLDLLMRLDAWGDDEWLAAARGIDLPEFVDAVLVGRDDEPVPASIYRGTSAGWERVPLEPGRRP